MLTVFEAGRRIIQLSGGWLYPLFALYVAAGRPQRAEVGPSGRARPLFGPSDSVRCEDTKIGQGAVFLYQAMGIGAAHGTVTSRLAAKKAHALGIGLSSTEWVDSLECRTESLLYDVTEPGEALDILTGRLRPEFLRAPQEHVTALYLDTRSAAARALQQYLARPPH